jgi:hypothetical protein
MNLPTDADTRSPWYETFAPQAAAWQVAPAEEQQPYRQAEAQPEADWATEAMFDYYNE